ncbi:MAG TPA: hypothetical protein PLD47_05810 [Aggregatilineales bacterium]|nr:hypothetical protein [Anaerolineales bacterium]HRE47223.1 hypothetical protein [Aggregatilineales bacterium]
MHARIVVVLALMLILAACNNANSTSPTEASPAAAIENFLRTRTGGDENAILPLVCKAREQEGRDTAASFKPMQAEITGLSCTTGAVDGEFTLVSCTGSMTTTYAGESRTLDLGARQYKALQENGVWTYCGMK